MASAKKTKHMRLSYYIINIYSALSHAALNWTTSSNGPPMFPVTYWYNRDGGEEQKEMQRHGQTISYDLMPILSFLHWIKLRDDNFYVS